MEHAVIHPGLRHRTGPAAVVAAVAHGHQREVPFFLRTVQTDVPVLPDAPEQEIRCHGGKVAAPAPEQRQMGEAADAVGYPGVNAVAGDGEAQPAAAVDEIQGEGGAVPEIFRVLEPDGVGAEIAQQVVAGAGGDAGHGRVGKPGDAAGCLMGRAVSAADIQPQRLSGLRQTAAAASALAGGRRCAGGCSSDCGAGAGNPPWR